MEFVVFNLLKVTVNILGSYLYEGDLTTISGDTAILRDIAYLCPFEYGPSVYIARSLLRSLDLEAEFNEAQLCGEIEPRSEKESNTGVYSNSIIIIYPNPVPIHFSLSITGKDIKQIEIYNMYGQLMFKQSKMDSINEIRPNINIPGVYWLKNSVSGNEVETYKIIFLQ